MGRFEIIVEICSLKFVNVSFSYWDKPKRVCEPVNGTEGIPYLYGVNRWDDTRYSLYPILCIVESRVLACSLPCGCIQTEQK